MVTNSRWLMTGSPTRCAFCNQPFVSAMATLSFGGRPTASTSAQSFALRMPRKRSSESIVPIRLVPLVGLIVRTPTEIGASPGRAGSLVSEPLKAVYPCRSGQASLYSVNASPSAEPPQLVQPLLGVH
jgi:hypothetical protein